MAKPTASIIMAAYNRAEVMRYAIQSVLQSDRSDWELIITGDGCTDESEAVARSFGDERISFVNLAENSGGQSTPNNQAVPRARGDFLFFLNQDDMYFSDHLSASIARLENTGADMLWSPVVLLRKSGLDAGPPDPKRDLIDIDGAVDAGGFDPTVFVITSSWVVRREACQRVGPWKEAEKTRLLPSQEWLFRAWRKGLKLDYHPHFSVLCIHAGTQRFSYLEDRSPAHERAWSWIEGRPRIGSDLLECLAVNLAARLHHGFRQQGWLPRLLGWTRHLGLHPMALQRAVAGKGKGHTINRIRRFTEDAPEFAVGDTLQLAENGAAPFLGSGWHAADRHGRWTSADPALICFRVPERQQDEAELALEIRGTTLKRPQTVEFRINGEPVASQSFDGFGSVRVPIGDASGLVRFHISVPTQSPRSLNSGSDRRELGFMMAEMALVSTRSDEPAAA